MQFRSIDLSKTTNLAGSEAYKQSDEYAFVSLLLTSFLNDTPYEKGGERIARLQKYAQTLDPIFVAQAAIYARKTHGIRSATHVVAGELINRLKAISNGSQVIASIINRPDDMLEIVSYYRSVYGKKLPAVLRKGIQKALNQFDEYQIAKYKSPTSKFKMVDLFNIIHPKPNEKQAPYYTKLMKNDLPSTETWEAKLSAAGSDTVAKKAAWSDLVKENKLGYFGLLRNLRNIVESAPEVVPMACEQLVKPESIKKSLVLPFRFQTAYDEMTQVPGFYAQMVVQALSQAADVSLANIPQFQGRTLIALDCSGSMDGKPMQIGALFAAALYKMPHADLLLFDTKGMFGNADKKGSVMQMAGSIRQVAKAQFNGGTDFNQVFLTGVAYDRIIILSDMQSWVQGAVPPYQKYCQQHKINPFIHSFDLQGHGTLQFPENKVFCYAGFSDKVFEVMALVEQDQKALLTIIKQIDIYKTSTRH